jgi:uncharacterized protein (TIGR02231 family)
MSVPKYSQFAYLRADCTLTGDAPLVPGVYSSFVDGVFSGRGNLERSEPGQEISIDLGVDEGIKIERKEIQAFHETTLSGKDRVTYSYEITIENTRNKNARITIKDQVPVSRDEGIDVKLIKTSPEVKPDQDGILTWVIELSPRKKEKMGFSFSITGTQLRPY